MAIVPGGMSSTANVYGGMSSGMASMASQMANVSLVGSGPTSAGPSTTANFNTNFVGSMASVAAPVVAAANNTGTVPQAAAAAAAVPSTNNANAATSILGNIIDNTFTGFNFGTSMGYGDVGDVLIDEAGERVNSAMWDNNDTTLSGAEFFTSSVQSASSGEYYRDVYRRNPSTNTTDISQFSIAYGHIDGSGSTTLEGQSEGMTPTKAIYKQYSNLLEDKTDANEYFQFSGSKVDRIFVFNFARGQFKERIDLGNWELYLHGDINSSVSPQSGLGVVHLVDEFCSAASASADDAGDRNGGYRIMSGTIAGGTLEQSDNPFSTDYGRVYPNEGIIVLNADAVSASCGGIQLYGSGSYSSTGGNSNFCYDCSGGTTQTTQLNPTLENLWYAVTGSRGQYFRARSVEHVHSRVYFCRVKNFQYNFSTNPTFQATGSDGLSNGQFRHSSMFGNPKVYITSIGLYSPRNELLAVAKLSKPLLKSFNREALIRVRLEF